MDAAEEVNGAVADDGDGGVDGDGELKLPSHQSSKQVIKRKSTSKISAASLRKKSTMKLSKDPSLSAPPEPMPAVITEEALSPVQEKEGSGSSPQKTPRTKTTPRDKRRGPKAKVVDAEAVGDGKSSHGGGGKLQKGNNATNLRIDKIEKYLHDRFDWLGILKQEREQKKEETSKERSKSNKKTEVKELPKLMNKKPKYKYMVDTSDKP